MVEINALQETDRKNMKFLKMLRDICDVVRGAEKKATPGLPIIVERAPAVLDKLLKYALSEDGLYKEFKYPMLRVL